MRNARMDNLRCLLIFLVVFGHFLTYFPGTETLYHIIYLFHMPAFLFLTGYYSHFSISKLLTELLYPYFIFQILYLLFDTLVLQGAPISALRLQFVVPFWLLWYLLDTIYCRLLIPLLDKIPRPMRPLILLASVGLALACGYVREFDYFLSSGRFFAFLPFFLAGYYLAQSQWFPAWMRKDPHHKWPFALAGGVVALCSCLWENQFTSAMLYGALPYHAAHFDPMGRLMQILFGFGWILALLTLVPNHTIPMITVLGQNTLPVYLLHGFAVRLAELWNPFHFSLWGNLLLAGLISGGLVVLLGNPHTRKPFRAAFTGAWLERLWRKYILT